MSQYPMKTTGSCVHAELFLEEFGIPLLSMKIDVGVQSLFTLEHQHSIL